METLKSGLNYGTWIVTLEANVVLSFSFLPKPAMNHISPTPGTPYPSSHTDQSQHLEGSEHTAAPVRAKVLDHRTAEHYFSIIQRFPRCMCKKSPAAASHYHGRDLKIWCSWHYCCDSLPHPKAQVVVQNHMAPSLPLSSLGTLVTSKPCQNQALCSLGPLGLAQESIFSFRLASKIQIQTICKHFSA